MHAAPPVDPPVAPPVAIERRRPDLEGSLRMLASIFTLQDAIALTYLTIMGMMVWWAPRGPLQPGCARVIYVTMAALVIGCVVSRALVGLPARLRASLYRFALVGVVLANYLTLRDFLYFIRPDSVDEALVRLDLRLFGVEPALWLERFNRPPIVEWFSFFYFSYFAIDAAYMVAVLWRCRPGRKTTEFALGTLLVFSIGQIGYTAVPGFGPIVYLNDRFHDPIAGGFWWSCVWSTVQAGGAMKDIFPSLHTAVPVWFTLYAMHQAKSDPRWRWPARVTAFFAVNIVVSTMLLRWHYGVDVVAGLLLATTVAVVTPRLAALEEAWRQAQGFPGPWCFDAGEHPPQEAK